MAEQRLPLIWMKCIFLPIFCPKSLLRDFPPIRPNCTARCCLSVCLSTPMTPSFSLFYFRSRYSSGPTPIMSAGDPSSTRSVSDQLNTLPIRNSLKTMLIYDHSR